MLLFIQQLGSLIPDQVLTGACNVPDDSQSQSFFSDDSDDDMHSDASEDPNDTDNVRGPDWRFVDSNIPVYHLSQLRS